ncbi:ABC transporter ATP-binding protein [Streptomyces sp. NPDC055109]
MVDTQILEAHDIRVYFRGVKALGGVDFTLHSGEIVGLIGPNGAGKTTLINALSGFQQVTAGMVSLSGSDVTNWEPSRLARAGLVRTFQDGRLFARLTCSENLECGSIAIGDTRRQARAAAGVLADRFGLTHLLRMPAARLSNAEQRSLVVARALAARPAFLLLDEPSAGLTTAEADNLMKALVAVNELLPVGLLIIEHDMRLIMRLPHRLQVLDRGKTVAEGTPDEILRNQDVLAAYLGGGAGNYARPD